MIIPPFSYLLTNQKKIRLEESPEVECLNLPCGRYLYYSHKLSIGFSHSESDGGYLVILGLFIDLSDDYNNLENTKIVASMLLENLKFGPDCFYEKLDWMAGRWVIISRKNNGAHTKMYGDATHSLKINFEENTLECSSNIFLIKSEISSDMYREEYTKLRRAWKYGTLGNLSPLKKIRILTPNQELDLDSGEMLRYWPRKHIAPAKKIEAAAAQVIQLCRTQKKKLWLHYKLLTSLTAGIDSRVSLAASGVWDQSESFFTYCFNSPHLVDATIASKICRRLNSGHFALLGDKYKNIDLERSEKIYLTNAPDIIKNVKRWNWYSHAHYLNSVYKTLIECVEGSSKNCLHIRSNLYEIGRCFWGSSEKVTINNLLKYSRPDWSLVANDVFMRFFEICDFERCAFFGYDLLDIFYWEHRCATWVSEVLQSSDFSFNTYCFMNCRKVMEIFLQRSRSERVSEALFNQIIQCQLPDLWDIPINPKV